MVFAYLLQSYRKPLNDNCVVDMLIIRGKSDLGCVRLGNPDLDFQNLNPDFPIEREIRKRISPPRNPSSGWISIKKSKSGFFGFPFYRSIGKSENGFAKLFS